MANDSNPIQSWCVILQTFAKKNRKELVAELVRGFGLDEQEASDAVSNLPLVVVDQLSLNQAKMIKEKLERGGAEIEITNHDIIKKQCYRIEWPAKPELTYFEKKAETLVRPSFPAVPPAPVAAAPALPPASPAPVQPLKVQPFPKAAVPVPGLSKSGPIEKNFDLPQKSKKAWFPFSRNKEKKAESPAKLIPRPVPKPKSNDIPYQPKSPAEINQTEWQKRTQEIQSRLEKMGALPPETSVKPSVRLTETDTLKPIHSASQPAAPEVVPVQEKLIIPELNAKTSERVETQKALPEAVKAQPEKLVNQSNELLEKIQKLEQELTEKKQNLEEKHAELERRNLEVEHKHRQVEEVQKLGSLYSEKVEHLERALSEKEQHLNAKHSELEQKHRLVEEVQKQGSTFSEKVEQLEKALTEKEQHLNIKHSELEQKSERERLLGETVAQIEARFAEKSAELETRKQELARLSAQYEEGLKAKDHELELIQRRMHEIAQKFQTLEQGLYEKQDLLVRKDAELQAKEQKIRDLQISSAELEKKANDAQTLEKDKEQQIAGLNAREKDLLKKNESLDKTLIEIGESLRQRDEALRQRDEVLVALERRVQDLAEKTGNYETLKAAHSKLNEEFEDVSGKFNRLSEEHRRFRSKSERKTAALTREMGEWVRKVDHLRQGLQKFNQTIVRPDLSDESESDSETPPSA